MTAPSTREKPEELRERMREVRAYGDAIRNFYAEHPNLHDDFPDQWVAVYGETVLNSDDFDDLLAEMDRQGLPRGQTFVRFVGREPEIYVF